MGATRVIGALALLATLAGCRPPRDVQFETVKRWDKGAMIGRRIVIEPRDRTEAKLKVLGEELRRETKRATHVYVEIYDDRRVAEQTDQWSASAEEDSEATIKEHLCAKDQTSPRRLHPKRHQRSGSIGFLD